MYLGISAKKKFGGARYEDTFYGIGVKAEGVEYYLDGMATFGDDGLIGKNGEKIKEKVDINHWKRGEEIELDIMFDGKTDNGTLKICRIPKEGNNAEVVFTEINNGGNTNGFVPNVVLCRKQSVRVYDIAPINYGEKLDL